MHREGKQPAPRGTKARSERSCQHQEILDDKLRTGLTHQRQLSGSAVPRRLVRKPTR